MVVLSAAVCTSVGKPVFARQFVPLTRTRVDNLLSAFPKLLENEKQHTFVETDEVRYVYQRMDSLYVLLITSKKSNIIEDLDTLRLMMKLIPEYCGGHSEELVREKAFELVFAFDEVVSLGHKEPVTVSQIRKFTEMDSAEEKLRNIMLEAKVYEAKDKARREAVRIEQEKAVQQEQSYAGGSGGGGRGGGGGGASGRGGGSGFGGGSAEDFGSDYVQVSSQSRSAAAAEAAAAAAAAAAAPVSSGKRTRGLELGRSSKKKDQFMSNIADEETKAVPEYLAKILEQEKQKYSRDMAARSGALGAAAAAASEPAAEPEEQFDTPVVCRAREQVSVTLDSEGLVQQFKLQGELVFQVNDPDFAKVVIKAAPIARTDLRVALHPHLDKKVWASSNELRLKNAKRGFPIGAQNGARLCRWSSSAAEEDSVPLGITCWPDDNGGQTEVNVECDAANLGITLHDVVIEIPIPAAAAAAGEPAISSCEVGSTTFTRNHTLLWHLGDVEPESSATLEFHVPQCEHEFLPIQVGFHSEQLLSGVEITDVVQVADAADAVEFTSVSALTVDSYQVVAQ